MKNMTEKAMIKIVPVTFIFAILALGLLLSLSCASMGGNKHPDVSIHLEHKNLAKSSLLVFNFREPPHAAGMGKYAAERFHVNLLKSRKFKVISLYNDSQWHRIAETEEKRLLKALEEDRAKQFDYILVGELTDCYYGGINPTMVRIKVRIIEVETRTTIFMAEHYKNSRGKDPSYPLTTKLSEKSRHPKALIEKMVKELIKRI